MATNDMNIFEEFANIVKSFEDADVRYALIGGVAMAFYAEPRFTRDIDLLIDADDYENAKKILGKTGYIESASPWTFWKIELTLHRFLKIVDEDEMMIDILVAHKDIHKKMIRDANEAESEGGIIRIATKDNLISLKGVRDSKQDQADIEKLKNEKDR